MKRPVSILWFRQDLRLADNPALVAASTGMAVLPVYVFDEKGGGDWSLGAASKVWLHHSLKSLDRSLKGKLVLLKGDPAHVIPHFAKSANASAVCWNRCYEPWREMQDSNIQAALEALNIETRISNTSILREPQENKNKEGRPFKVFTPFYKKLYANADIAHPIKRPDRIEYAAKQKGVALDDLHLLPEYPRWDRKFDAYWNAGEDAAQSRLQIFLDQHFKGYAEGRNRPDLDHVSRLSPHLHWGEISPRHVWHEVRLRMISEGLEKDGTRFLTELGWREFSYGLLNNFPALPDKPLRESFTHFPWKRNKKAFNAWKKGRTGYPIVDAGMRELWETGYMHNRVRMITASFLIKDLLIHWREGEKWFWDCLVDADLANNSANWQWVAGCGADAAPFFRVFNPTLQGRKFDPKGNYVRRWIPELADIPNHFIHEPWKAPEPPKDYPLPIVNHEYARKTALQAFGTTRKAG